MKIDQAISGGDLDGSTGHGLQACSPYRTWRIVQVIAGEKQGGRLRAAAPT